MQAEEALRSGYAMTSDDVWANAVWLQAASRPQLEVVGGVFADDAQWFANSRDGLEVAVRISEDFLQWLPRGPIQCR